MSPASKGIYNHRSIWGGGIATDYARMREIGAVRHRLPALFVSVEDTPKIMEWLAAYAGFLWVVLTSASALEI